MRECEYYQELMSRLLDEGLTEAEETALREHMRTCPQCRRMGAAFTEMTAALREDLAEPPVDLARGVMERIRDEDRPRPKTSRSGKLLRPWTRAAAAACLVLIVAGVSTVALRNRTKSASAENLAAQSVADTAEEKTARAATSGDQPMIASIQDGEAVYDPEDAPMEASAGGQDQAAAGDSASASGAAPEAPAPEPSQEPLPVYDAARTRIGVIAPEDIPAFEALITDEGWAEGDFEYLLKVEYRHKTYAFATDGDDGLVWWEEPSTQPLRSPGSFSQLRALIAMDDPALPQ